MTSISVVIPAYNYAKTVERAIHSVLPQLSATDELLIINDGSTDDTVQRLDALLAQGHPFRCIHQENAGLAAVRNRGVRETHGEFLIFLDADDEMHAGALTAFRQHAQQHPQSRLVIGGHIAVHPSGRTRAHAARPLAHTPEQRFLEYIDRKFGISNGACMMHRSIFDVLTYPEQFRASEDTAIFALALALFESSAMDTPAAHIYKHDDSMRHHLPSARAVGTRVVDVLFDHPALPKHLQKYRSRFLARRCLSLMRTFAEGGDPSGALQFYRQALLASPFIALRAKPVRRALRACIATLKHQHSS